MKDKLRTVLMLMAALAVLAAGTPARAQSLPFTDISDVQGKEAIVALYEKGHVKGVGGGLFAPNAPMTGAQAVQLLVNALELDLDGVRFVKEPLATDHFIHANDGAWYAPAMIVAAVNGLEFPADLRPDQALTRKEFLHHLSGAMGIGADVLDAGSGSDPTDVLRRSEAAVLLVQALAYAEGKTGTGGLEHSLTATPVEDGFLLEFLIVNRGEAQTLTYSSGQQFNYIVHDGNGEVVYNWVIDKSFLMAIIEQPLAKDEEFLLTDTWNLADNAGNRLPAGEYRIVFESSFSLGDTPVTISDEVTVVIE
ncbi:BsuPI-related putative proteinase inhibitor [Anaerotalea alkaliphila]|uniref:SLH domain-containing protein n=1 Tax=Anaerotalea alkaliphila TaxID=2662126 RepID=A0A7X5KMA2_9FIRM|nr:BsuPI-related putative proteinase inhibitor [Anaerotalea alkaliphila]NDL67741.1 hypothetical protein [Anaerotalea alkaliphila]